MQDRSSQNLRSADGRRSWKAPLLIAGALLFALTACESLPRDDNWSMFDRDRPTRAGS